MDCVEPRLTSVRVPCTCGELFQGTLDGRPCLVSCPVDVYSAARVTAGAGNLSHPSAPDGRRKVNRALEWLSCRTGHAVNVEVTTPLPVGRGYGTSTADIGAALCAASRALGVELSPGEMSLAAVRIEPTDSTLFPGLALFDHREGRFHLPLGTPPPARLIILDPGWEIDTEAFNAVDHFEALAGVAAGQRTAFEILQEGVAAGDLAAIGEASTLSAQLHQSMLPNPLVDSALSLSKALGAAGICRAHSGAVVGLIFPDDFDVELALRYLRRRLSRDIHTFTARLTGGGPLYTDGADTG